MNKFLDEIDNRNQKIEKLINFLAQTSDNSKYNIDEKESIEKILNEQSAVKNNFEAIRLFEFQGSQNLKGGLYNLKENLKEMERLCVRFIQIENSSYLHHEITQLREKKEKIDLEVSEKREKMIENYKSSIKNCS